MLTFPITFFGAQPPRIDYTSGGSSIDGTDSTSYTFSLNCGTEAADRFLIVATSVAALGGDLTTPQTVTMNGNATTDLTTNSFTKFNGLLVPTGTTVSIGITRGGNNMSSYSATVWSAYNLTSTTPVATSSTGGAGNPATGGVNTNAGDCIVGWGTTNTTGTVTFSWSGLSEDVENNATGVVATTGAHANAVAGATPFNVSVTRSAGTIGGLLLASFR